MTRLRGWLTEEDEADRKGRSDNRRHRLPAFAVLSPVFVLLIVQPLIPCGQEMPGSSGAFPGPPQEVRLAPILNKALRYCRRLETAALDFVCLEEIAEKIDLSKDEEDEIYVPLGTGIRTQIRIAKRKQENTYLYDFQFTRKGELKRENRNLLEKNGKPEKNSSGPGRQSFTGTTSFSPSRPTSSIDRRGRRPRLTNPYLYYRISGIYSGKEPEMKRYMIPRVSHCKSGCQR